MPKNLNNIIFLVCLGLLIMFDMCDRRAENSSHLNDVKSIVSYNEKEKEQVIKDTNLVVVDMEVMKQNLLSQKSANELLKKELEDYKKLNSFIKAELITSINNLEIAFSSGGEEIPPSFINSDLTIHRDTVSKYFTRVPKSFSHNDDQWFSISGKVSKSGVLFDAISFVNKFDITIGYKKGKRFYSKSEPIVELKSYNPYTSVPYINNIVVSKDKTPWYYSRAAMFVYGLGTGYGISTIKNN